MLHGRWRLSAEQPGCAGGELGRGWYADGARSQKLNGAVDLAACMDYLVQHKYAAPSRIVLHASSAGGILGGAILNSQPQVIIVPVIQDVYCCRENTLKSCAPLPSPARKSPPPFSRRQGVAHSLWCPGESMLTSLVHVEASCPPEHV